MQKQKYEYLSKESSLRRSALETILQALADHDLTCLKADDLSLAILGCLREIMAADNLAILLLTEDHTAFLWMRNSPQLKATQISLSKLSRTCSPMPSNILP